MPTEHVPAHVYMLAPAAERPVLNVAVRPLNTYIGSQQLSVEMTLKVTPMA